MYSRSMSYTDTWNRYNPIIFYTKISASINNASELSKFEKHYLIVFGINSTAPVIVIFVV